MITKLFKGTRLWLGNNSFVLSQDAEGNLENVSSIDGVAEVLAGNVQNYGVNIAALAHDEDGPPDEDGNPTKIHVSYGVGGARIETPVADVVDVAAIQAANVAEADAARKTETPAERSASSDLAFATADVTDGIRIPDGAGGFQDPSKGDMRKRLVEEMVNAPRQFSSTGEITPGSENAFTAPVTADIAEAALEPEVDNRTPAQIKADEKKAAKAAKEE